MGHGYNHYHDCSCPWCTNQRIGKKLSKSEIDSFISSKLLKFRECWSTTNPNAKCIFCNEPIFFYQNSNGSKVFFDFLGKPWKKHDCYYEKQGVYQYEIDIDLHTLPAFLETYDIEKTSHLHQVTPIIKTHLLNDYKIISFFNTKANKNTDYVVHYKKQNFGLAFLKSENEKLFLDIYIDEKEYYLECHTLEKARELFKNNFPYEIGEKIQIEIFKEYRQKDRTEIYIAKPIKKFSIGKPKAFIYDMDISEQTIKKLDISNGVKVWAISVLNDKKEIIFKEIEN